MAYDQSGVVHGLGSASLSQIDAWAVDELVALKSSSKTEDLWYLGSVALAQVVACRDGR